MGGLRRILLPVDKKVLLLKVSNILDYLGEFVDVPTELHFLQSSDLPSLDYINEEPTLTECKKEFEISVFKTLFSI